MPMPAIDEPRMTKKARARWRRTPVGPARREDRPVEVPARRQRETLPPRRRRRRRGAATRRPVRGRGFRHGDETRLVAAITFSAAFTPRDPQTLAGLPPSERQIAAAMKFVSMSKVAASMAWP